MNEAESRLISRYWGKTALKEREPLSLHPLVYHCLDVAACGRLLLRHRPKCLRQIEKLSGITEATLLEWLTFLFAIHDVGKFADGFQNLRTDLFQRLQRRTSQVSYQQRHDTLGYRFAQEELAKLFMDNRSSSENPVDVTDLKNFLSPWISAVTGHHGRPPTEGLYPPPLRMQFPRVVREDALLFLKKMMQLFLPNGLHLNPSDEHFSGDSFNRASWLVAGAAVAGDWMGSNRRWFEYWDKEEILPLDFYWQEIAVEKAKEAIIESGLHSARPAVFVGIKEIFPMIKYPTALQQLSEGISFTSGPQLFLIEEITGGGKTEAALTLAHRLMDAGNADGLYFALPTMATANAMHERITAVYRKMFEEGSKPSLVLAHSAARMVLDLERRNQPDQGYGRQEESASQDCSAWLSDSRKKALLANAGVGTIDQALLSILPVRHQSLRLFGLTHKVLIVDEVHACDAYVLRLLTTLLKFHAAMGGSAILLSATLPQGMRFQLVKAFALGAGYQKTGLRSTAYPLVTHLDAGGFEEVAVSCRKDLARRVSIEPLHNSEEAQAQLWAALNEGKCACWVRNTVYDAMTSYREWVQKIGPDKVMLFHARFALGDRLSIEENVKSHFGQKSSARVRRGRLLIATQVVEQSLDLDFDFMVTDLAPIDLIIQRAGRLRRHNRDALGNCVEGADQRGTIRLAVLMPEVYKDATGKWYQEAFPKAAFVYPHHGQLWLTARWLLQNRGFSMPEDARNMIESVYGESFEEHVPPGLQEVENRAEGEDRADKSLAQLNGLNLDEGYLATMNQWQDDSSAPTRLGEPTTTVRLARWINDRLEPWIKDSDHDWELSQLSVRKALINSEGPDFEREIKEAKATMLDQGKYCVSIPLRQEGESWVGKAKDSQERQVGVQYDSMTGLQIIRGEQS